MVTDLGDSGAPGQLRTLVAAAASGDVIVIPSGTIALRGDARDGNEGGDLDIDKTLTIVGAGENLTVLEGSGSDRVLEIFENATVVISEMTIQDGNDPTDYGGGISNLGSLQLYHVAIARNRRGGGLANFAIARLTEVTIDGNAAAGSGGGIYNTGTLVLERVTISHNSAGGAGFQSGGGILSTGSLMLTNVTISGNSAVLFGGGIAQLGSAADLTNVTIADNTGPASSAGIFSASTTLRLRNVIVANGSGVTNCSGSGFYSLGHNLSDDGSCGLGDRSDRVSDPRLGPLRDNGGPTATHALLPLSPGIDTGDDTDCPDTDQRGTPRRADGDGDGTHACDVGAYEVQPACSGDCGNDGAVTIDELVLMVNAALGADSTLCRNGDVDGDQQIAISEVVGAVNAALNGCSASPQS